MRRLVPVAITIVVASVVALVTIAVTAATDGPRHTSYIAGDAFAEPSMINTSLRIPFGVPSDVSTAGFTNMWKVPVVVTSVRLVTSRGEYRILGKFNVNGFWTPDYLVLPELSRAYVRRLLYRIYPPNPITYRAYPAVHCVHLKSGKYCEHLSTFWSTDIRMLPERLGWIDVSGFEFTYIAQGQTYREYVPSEIHMHVVTRSVFDH